MSMCGCGNHKNTTIYFDMEVIHVKSGHPPPPLPNAVEINMNFVCADFNPLNVTPHWREK